MIHLAGLSPRLSELDERFYDTIAVSTVAAISPEEIDSAFGYRKCVPYLLAMLYSCCSDRRDCFGRGWEQGSFRGGSRSKSFIELYRIDGEAEDFSIAFEIEI